MNKDPKCGDANSKGNIAFYFKGACKKSLKIEDSYRCVGCDGWFHKQCIVGHFQLEKDHDWGRKQERKELLEEVERKLEDSITIDRLEAHSPQVQFIAKSMGDAMTQQIKNTLNKLKCL